MSRSDKIITAVLTIILGLLFIILKGEIIGITMTVLGVGLIISAVIDAVHRLYTVAIVKAVVGILIIIFGWVLVSAVLYIFAALLLIYGIVILCYMVKCRFRGFTKTDTVLKYLEPSLCIVIAVFLLFNQGGTINWIFIVVGIALILEGIIAFVNSFTKSNKT